MIDFSKNRMAACATADSSPLRPCTRDSPVSVAIARGIVHTILTIFDFDQRHVFRVYRIKFIAAVSTTLNRTTNPFPDESVAGVCHEDPRSISRDVRRNRLRCKVLAVRCVRITTWVQRHFGSSRDVLPCREKHRPAIIIALWWINLGCRNARRVLFGLPVAQSITRFEGKVEPIGTHRADDALALIFVAGSIRREAIDPPTPIGKREKTWSADAVKTLHSDSVFMSPMQHVIRHGTADDGRSIRRSMRLEIHSPSPVRATRNRRRKHSQRHMRHSRLRRDSNAGFGIKLQAIARERAQDISLASCIRLCGSDGRVEKPVAAIQRTGHARRLNLQFIQRPCPLYSRGQFFSPSVFDTHRLNLIKRRLRR